jgi:hypothetical protein
MTGSGPVEDTRIEAADRSNSGIVGGKKTAGLAAVVEEACCNPIVLVCRDLATTRTANSRSHKAQGWEG